eukprot:sb/3472262/
MVEELREVELTGHRSLNKLTYTEMVLLESLRMTPVLLRGTRWLKNPVNIGGFNVPGDCQFQYSQYVLHRNEKYWKNPREFDPERFRNGVPNVDSMTYMPFLSGPRACLGRHVAMVSMKLMLSTIARNYDLTPQPVMGRPPKIVQTMAVSRLEGGPFYHFKPLYKVQECN